MGVHNHLAKEQLQKEFTNVVSENMLQNDPNSLSTVITET